MKPSLFVGIDLSDAYAMTPRKVDVARLNAQTGQIVFSQFEWPTEGAGWAVEVARVVGSLGHDKAAFIVDGPQALARVQNNTRLVERYLRTPGHTPWQVPDPGVGPFAGFIKTSIKCFSALVDAGFNLAELGNAENSANLFEAYPGAVWPLWHRCAQRLQKKSTFTGRKQRRAILEAVGCDFDRAGELTPDQLDAGVCAALGWRFFFPNADWRVELFPPPTPPVEQNLAVFRDPNGILREGRMLMPQIASPVKRPAANPLQPAYKSDRADLQVPAETQFRLTDIDNKKNSLELKRLVLAKMLYRHGCTCASRKDTVSRMVAIHHFDNAVEMILRCAATKRGTKSPKKQPHFEDFLNEIGDIALKEQMVGLHRVRNAVQHQGDVPSMESVIKYRGYAEDFFREICKRIFSVPYEELFLSGLIENENLRERLLKAEEAFGREEYQGCIELCDEALMSATFEEADVFSKAGLLTGYWGASEELSTVLKQDYLEKYRHGENFELARELRGALIQWGQATTGMQFLGEYRMDFLKHRRIVEALQNLPAEELKKGADLSLNFVTNLILKWQEEGLQD